MTNLNRKRRFLCAILLGLCGWTLSLSPSAWGFVTNVNIIDDGFSPASVRINLNDQVKWTWRDSDHSTTSNNGLWNSGVRNQGYTYTHIFTSSGSFPYHCSKHFFNGSVVVTNSRPTVAITNPPNGAVLGAPATFALRATASDTNGSVTNVQFFQGTISLGNVTNNPYSRAMTNLGAGDYTFSAVASDNGGLKATNAIMVHVVTPVPITLSAPRRLSLTSLQFNYTANVGLTYSVQRSPDLSNWIGLGTNQAISSLSTFIDNSASNDPNFYRVQLLPNP